MKIVANEDYNFHLLFLFRVKVFEVYERRTMYQFPNQSTVHNGYHQFFGVPTNEPVISTQESGTISTNSLVDSQPATAKPKSDPTQSEADRQKSIGVGREAVPGKKGCVDTSSFTVEQRVVAAAWVHERHHTHTSIGQIKQQFEERFGRAAPAKNTLLVWERKLFSSGSVHDAPRPGRPARRKLAVGEVSASLRSAPALSVRARAAALCVPRSTLRALLRRGLPAPALAPVKQKARRSPPEPRALAQPHC